MKTYTHLFFDMDMTIAPARQPILPEMYKLLDSLKHDIIVVSGQTIAKIDWQSNHLPSYTLGQNGNHATDVQNMELWKNSDLSDAEKAEIHAHIEKMVALLEQEPNPEWTPIEDRGAQITFSPVGNTAPVEIKLKFDPDRKRRESLLKKVPFSSETLVIKFGGSTSFDYFRKDGHKGANVARLIKLKNWNKDECVYFGDGLGPGGNDECVIGVIDTIPVTDNFDTYDKLKAMFG